MRKNIEKENAMDFSTIHHIAIIVSDYRVSGSWT